MKLTILDEPQGFTVRQRAFGDAGIPRLSHIVFKKKMDIHLLILQNTTIKLQNFQFYIVLFHVSEGFIYV